MDGRWKRLPSGLAMRNLARQGLEWVAVACALAALLWLPAPARAADIYRIDSVAVDATGDSGVAARDAALAAGQREGLVRLMQRLTSPADHGRLPDVAGVPIEQYVNSFEIAQERVGPNQYLGVINVSYVAGRVRGLLSSAGIPFVTRRSDPILVVPLTVVAGRPDVWAETSAWRSAWLAGIDSATVINVTLPLGDLADIAAATPEALAAGDPATLETLATRYGALTTVVATATAAEPDLSGAVAVELRTSDDWGKPIFEHTVEMPPGTDPGEVLKPVVADAIVAIENDWKQRTAQQAAAVSTIDATVPLAGLGSWVQIKRELNDLPEIRYVSVESFTQSRAKVTIGHLGDLERLKAAVARAGLALSEETDGWQLLPAAALAEPSVIPLEPAATP
ncbi:MAG: DUF2066 domain-containing protein [Geminicoccaceae bacterium]